MKLERWQKIALLLVSAGLWVTGVLWLVLEWFVPGTLAERHWCMVIHGLLSMGAAVLFGMLYEHARRGLRAKRHYRSGLSLVCILVILIITAWMLYYVSGEEVRAAASYVHWILGIAMLPLLTVVHLLRYQKKE